MAKMPNLNAHAQAILGKKAVVRILVRKRYQQTTTL